MFSRGYCIFLTIFAACPQVWAESGTELIPDNKLRTVVECKSENATLNIKILLRQTVETTLVLEFYTQTKVRADSPEMMPPWLISDQLIDIRTAEGDLNSARATVLRGAHLRFLQIFNPSINNGHAEFSADIRDLSQVNFGGRRDAPERYSVSLGPTCTRVAPIRSQH